MKALFVVLAGTWLSLSSHARAEWRRMRKRPRGIDGLKSGGELCLDRAIRAARSVALFTEMGKVIQSPRCLNCHPRR